MPDPLLDILGEPENKVSATSPKEVSLDDIFGEPELKKKEPSEVGSEVGGLSTTPAQDSSLDGFDRTDNIPVNPFEKQALGQPPIDEAIKPTDVKPKVTSKTINPEFEKQGVGEENWKALKSASLRAAGGVIGIPALINSTIFEYIQRPIMKITGATDDEIDQERQASKMAQVGALPVGLTEIGIQQINVAASQIESTMKQYEGGIIESIDKGDFGDAGRQLLKGFTQSLPYLAMVGATSGGGTPAVLTTLGTASASQRKGEIEEQGLMEGEYGKQILNSWLYGGFEAGGELFTAGIFNNLKRALKGASEEVIKKTAKDVAFQFLKEFTGESISEGGTELGQQLTDYFMGERDNIDFKQVGDAMIIGGFAAGPIAGTTSVADYIKGSRIAPKEDVIKVQENQEKIIDLKDKVEESDNPVIKEAVEEKISQIEKENIDIAEKNAKLASDLTPEQLSEVSNINRALDENEAVIAGKQAKNEDVKIEEEVKVKLDEKKKEALKKKKAEPEEEGEKVAPGRTRESVMAYLKNEGYTDERANQMMEMFDFFTEKYTYEPDEYVKAKKEGKLPTEEVVEPQSQIIRPIKFDKEGDLTDESFDDLTNDLRNTITEVANKYNIPEGSLLKHFHITDKGEYFSGTTPILKAGESIEFNSLFDTVIGVLEDAGYKDVDSIYEYKRELLNALERDETPKVPKKIQEVLSAIQEIGDSFQENIKSKITEEPKDAKGILKTQEQVSPGGDAIKEGEGVSRPDVQQKPEAGAKTGDEGKRLITDEEIESDIYLKARKEVNDLYNKYKDSEYLEEKDDPYRQKARIIDTHANELSEDVDIFIESKLGGIDFEDPDTPNYKGRKEGFTHGSQMVTLDDYYNNLIQERVEEVSQPEIEPEVAKKLRSVANKIREGKISRIQGFKADTPFTLAWDGGLEVLATTLEATADLTVAIDKALTHIKNTEWYKNLTKDRQVEFDKKFEEHIDKELGDEYRDATKHKFVNKDVEERFNQAVIHPKTFMDKAKEAFTDLRDKILRTYKDLPKNKRFAEAYNAINQFQKGVEISSSKAGDIITRILGKMSKPDYELFTKKIIFDDLLETIKMNPVYELPYGLTEETLKQELDNINKFVAFNAKVKDAIKKRKEVYKEVQSEYVDYANKIGVKTEGYFERNDYFRHQVLLYSEASKGTIERKGSPLSRPKKLSLFKERVQGRGLDINRNYIESEFEVFNKLLYAIEKMKMIDNIYRNYDIMKDLKAKAKEELGEEATRAEINRWVEDNIPDGYVIDSPENMNIFMAQSIPESLVQDLLLGNVEEMGIKRDDLRKIFALGAAKKIVIPTEIYKTMDNISRVNDKDRFAQFSKKLLTGWKIWTLIQPKRFFKYNIRNLTGDSEAVFLGNPRVFKKTLASARELYDVFVSKDTPSPDMNEYISRGGLQLVLTTQEIGELRKVKEFEKYYDNKRNVLSKAWDGYWKTAKLTTDFREQLLRYAAYKEWLSEIDKNNGKVKNYGASNREFIDGLESKYDKAFRLSNELLGAYDQISEAGQNLRSYWIPFWSFQEINFRRTNQMFLNALDSEKSLSGKSLKGLEFVAKKLPFVAFKTAKLSIKLTGFWAMTAVWNALMFGDEEDELPEEIRSKPHIIFGRNPDGTIRYLSRLGVMGDYMEWFGLDSMPMYVSEWLGGRMTTGQIAKEMALSAPNKLVNGVNPYVKTTAELIFKKSLFPDISKPRVIRNEWEQIAINLGIKDEFRAVTNLPDQAYYKSIRKIFWDEIDPLASAYWNIVSLKYQFKAQKGNDSKGSYSVSDRSLSLYYYKQALTYGDTASAEHYLDKYILLGGTKRGYNSSMSYLDPLRGIKDEEKEEFMKFLGAKNKKQLEQAMKYYDKVLNLKMDWPDDKLEEELDTVEIPL